MMPPVMFTLLESCDAIVPLSVISESVCVCDAAAKSAESDVAALPKPKFVREVAALPTSDKLLELESRPELAVTPPCQVEPL